MMIGTSVSKEKEDMTGPGQPGESLNSFHTNVYVSTSLRPAREGCTSVKGNYVGVDLDVRISHE